jgi:hypothetical protein
MLSVALINLSRTPAPVPCRGEEAASEDDDQTQRQAAVPCSSERTPFRPP